VLQLAGIKLSSLPIPQKAGFDVDGELSLAVKAGGHFSQPTVVADLTVRNSQLALSSPAVDYSIDKIAATVTFADSLARITAAVSDREKNLLEMNGQSGLALTLIPFHFEPKPETFELSVNARDLKLSALPLPKQKGIQFDANINLNARAAGNIARPAITGHLSLRSGFFSLSDPPLSYETFSGDIDFSPREIQIRSLQLEGDSEGSLSLSGRIGIAEFVPTDLDVKLKGKNLLLPYKPAAFARVQPELGLSGTFKAPVLTGNINVVESRLNVDLLSDQSPAEIQIDTSGTGQTVDIGMTEKKTGAAEWLDPLAADLTVDIHKNAWIRGQNLNSEIGGQINIKKAPLKPFILVGPLNILKGNFTFQNRLFKISRGLVDFVGLEEPDPNLNIKAETRIKKVKITVSVTGTARNMILSLDSEPQMDRTDIISYLVFGQPASELKGQQDFNAQEAALSFAGQVALKELKNILGGTTFIDTFSLEAQDGDLGKGTATFGKYVHPDVFVLYRHRFKADEPDEVEVVYEINRNYSIETQLGNERTTGIDFVWEFDF